MVINAGDAGTAWSGGELWADEEIVTAVRKYVYNGGGFIGVGEPTAHQANGKFFQLSDVLGVEQERGLTLSEDKYTDDGRVIVRTNELGRQLTTQYPSVAETTRCGVMEDFGEQNQKVLEMWSEVKANKISALSYIMMVLFGILAIVMLVTTIRRKMKKRRRMRK